MRRDNVGESIWTTRKDPVSCRINGWQRKGVATVIASERNSKANQREGLKIASGITQCTAGNATSNQAARFNRLGSSYCSIAEHPLLPILSMVPSAVQLAVSDFP